MNGHWCHSFIHRPNFGGWITSLLHENWVCKKDLVSSRSLCVWFARSEMQSFVTSRLVINCLKGYNHIRSLKIMQDHLKFSCFFHQLLTYFICKLSSPQANILLNCIRLKRWPFVTTMRKAGGVPANNYREIVTNGNNWSTMDRAAFAVHVYIWNLSACSLTTKLWWK